MYLSIVAYQFINALFLRHDADTKKSWWGEAAGPSAPAMRYKTASGCRQTEKTLTKWEEIQSGPFFFFFSFF
jgi:hypothetical protein